MYTTRVFVYIIKCNINRIVFLACNPREGMSQGTRTLRIQALWLQMGGKDFIFIILLLIFWFQRLTLLHNVS